MSWQVTDSAGRTSYPFGPNPEGQITYTASGRMSAQLMNPGVDVASVTGVDPGDLLGRVTRTFFAYYGTYSVDPDAGTVTHHVEGT